MNKFIEVYLTAYNEEKSIVETIAKCIQEIERLHFQYKINVVDNNSSDQTCTVVKLAYPRNPKINIVKFEENLGYSISVFKSLLMSKNKYAIVMDADGQFSPRYFEDFIRAIDSGADLVLGARTRKIGNARRKLGSSLFLFFSRIILRFDGPDINVGMRCISGELQKSLIGAQKGRLANPNIWIQAKQANLKISYVRIMPNERTAGSSYLPWASPIKLTIESVAELLRIRSKRYDFVA
jgi:glycosyltransferase involved in cell wall biosynthesis